MRRLWVVASTLAATLALMCCAKPVKKEPVAFTEIRIQKSSALHGGEILLLRNIGENWSAKLLGDAQRLSCDYEKDAVPKSTWDSLYAALLEAGVKEISGKEPHSGLNDGVWYVVEMNSMGKVTRYVVDNPKSQKSESAKKVIKIGDIISREFDSPVFSSDDRNLGDYLIENCRDYYNKLEKTIKSE